MKSVFLCRLISGVAGVVLVFAAVVWFNARQGPEFTETVDFYEVDALDRKGLLRQFSVRGPHGYAAMTRWYVDWSLFCQVRLRTEILLPKHVQREALTDYQRQEWDRYLVALRLHERSHQLHGMSAAKEVAGTYCFGARSIIGAWAEQDKLLDHRTQHGAQTGVWLKM